MGQQGYFPDGYFPAAPGTSGSTLAAIQYFQFLTDFRDYSVTPTSEDSPLYAATKLTDYDHLRRCWHSTDLTKQSLIIDFGSSKSVIPFFLEDVNFAKAQVAWNDTNVWTAPSIAFQDHIIPKDYDTMRSKKIIAPPSSGNLRYMNITIPNQATTDGEAFFRIGRLIIPETTITLTLNPSVGYDKKVAEPEPIMNLLMNGTPEMVSMGTYMQMTIKMQFDTVEEFDMVTMRALNAIPRTQQVILYENQDDASQAWLLLRKDAMDRSAVAGLVSRVQPITYQEIIG